MLTPVLTYAAQSLDCDARAYALAAQRLPYHRPRPSRPPRSNPFGRLARELVAAPPLAER